MKCQRYGHTDQEVDADVNHGSVDRSADFEINV